MKKDLDIFFVSPNNNLKEVMQKIDQNGYSTALIIDENKKLLGLVTDGDIRRAIINGIWLEEKIEKIMNPSPYYLDEETDIKKLFEIIIEKKINHLPILDKDKKVINLMIGEEIGETLTKKLIKLTKENLNEKRKHILVTGGAGYIGSVLVRKLLEKGYKVKVLDKLLYDKNSLSELVNNKNFKLIKGDIGNTEIIIEAIKDVDAAVHLAEIVGDPACAANPQRTQEINYLSTTLLANACKYLQINRFIYASSCSVYGASERGELLSEDSKLNPISLYSKIKTESEKTILSLADGTFSPTILRFATVFGVSPRMRFDLVINTLTAKAVKEGKITLFGGDQWRPFVHVSDVTKAIIAVLEAPLEKVKQEIFNVGSNENNFTINQIGEFVKDVIPKAELIIQEKNIDKRNYNVDFSKIKNTLGLVINKTIKDGIKEISLNLNNGKFSDYLEPIYYNDKSYNL